MFRRSLIATGLVMCAVWAGAVEVIKPKVGPSDLSLITPPMPKRLKIADNRRYLIKEDGAPFFYLGDTAWELFHRLNREETDLYLADRARKGFTVIEAVALAEFGGLTEPNRYGHLPLKESDPTKPVEEYF